MKPHFLYTIIFAFIFRLSSASAPNVAQATVTFSGGAPVCEPCQSGVYTSSFACSYNDRGNWDNGLRVFDDPTPADSLVTSVSVTINGAFGCGAFNGNAEVYVILQNEQVGYAALPSDMPCYCGNCVGNYTMAATWPGDWPGYNHSGSNNLQLIVAGSGQICVSSIDILLYYYTFSPFSGKYAPPLGPVQGGTVITVVGVALANDTDDIGLVCAFGSQIVTALYGGPGTLLCTAPSRNESGTVNFQVHTALSDTPFNDLNPSAAVTGRDPAFKAFQHPYYYYSEPLEFSVRPVSGTASGGTAVTICSSDIFNSSYASCIFGDTGDNAVPCAFQEEGGGPGTSCLVCASPGAEVGTAAWLLVSLNGQQYVNTSQRYTWQSTGTLSLESWLILGGCIAGGAALIALFLGLLRRNFRADGYQRIAEGRAILFQEIQLGVRIGKGNFGEVFKAYWRGATIAVKKLPVHNMNDTFLREFHKEVALMRALRHPNVLQFLGSCTVEPDICLLMEYMPRGSLYRILHDVREVLPWALLRKMCIDAARGMLYLHSSQPMIVHRDMKSHNLLVDENWKVKVCDFGLSTIVEQASHTMTACGTPCWTAPEVLRNQRYTEKADVYSFGIVLWECATRQDPYAGMPPFQVIFAVGREGARPPLPHNCPPEFARLVTDCWDENPLYRPSMQEILQRLEALDVTGWPDVQCTETGVIL